MPQQQIPPHPFRGAVPNLGALQQQKEMQQKQQQIQIQAAIQQLSQAIYVQFIGVVRDYPLDDNNRRELAKSSMTAARCYFEGIGVLGVEQPTGHDPPIAQQEAMGEDPDAGRRQSEPLGGGGPR